MEKDITETRDTATQALTEALQTGFRVLRWLVVGLLAAYVLSGVFVVGQHELALVVRLGRVDGLGAERVKGPGLHWTWPRPLARVLRVPAERVQTVVSPTFWPRQAPDQQEEMAPPSGPTLNPERDGYLLTGDANILHARWALRYTLSDPERWLFGWREPEEILLRELDAAVVRQTARLAIDRALRSDVAALREAVERDVVERVRALELGVRVQGLDLLALAPPGQVAAAFDAVIQAEMHRGQRISEARAAAARTRSGAAGEAARVRAEGETHKRRQMAEIEADADRFRQMLPAYTRNPDVFKRTLAQDSVGRALAGVKLKFVVDAGRGAQQWRLQLGPEGAASPERE